MNSLAENLASVKARIASAQANSPSHDACCDSDIKLIAVSKTKTASDVQAVYEAGQRDFGENYLQDALGKIQSLNQLDIRWHFIGPIQSNKTRPIAENFDWVQTVDRVKIAERLNNQRPEELAPLNVCIQINLDNEASKTGATMAEAKQLATAIDRMPNLILRGLMFIPKPQHDPHQQLESCMRANEQFRCMQNEFATMDTLSLGMSADLEAAIQAGSNMVRIGTDIFGARAT